jgi:hypothetical protein
LRGNDIQFFSDFGKEGINRTGFFGITQGDKDLFAGQGAGKGFASGFLSGLRRLVCC